MDACAKLLTKKVVAKGPHPYSIGEEPGFLDPIAAAALEFVVPSRTMILHSVVSNLYQQKVLQVKSELRSCFTGCTECCSITTDGCTLHSGDNFLFVM